MKAKSPKPFGWWWQRFLKEARRPGEATFSEFESMFFDPERGFMCWMLTAGLRVLEITECCGDGRFWRD